LHNKPIGCGASRAYAPGPDDKDEDVIMKLSHRLVPVLRICETLSLWPFHVLMACTVGLELNDTVYTYWVMVKKDTYRLAQKSLDVRSNMLNSECRVTFATAGSVCHT